MKKGTIVLTPFPFTNLQKSKLRPALVVSQDSDGHDTIFAFITSQIKEPISEVSLLLEVNHPDFKETGLKKESLLKLDKLVTLEKTILLGRLGRLSDDLMLKVDEKLKIVFDLK